MRMFCVVMLLTLGVNAFGRSLSIDPNQSGVIAIGTSTSSPTQIFTNDPSAIKTCVVNTSTNTVFFVGYSTTSALGIATNATISTSSTAGSFSLPGSSSSLQAMTFCFDGPNDSFTGPVWAACATPGNYIQRIRMH